MNQQQIDKIRETVNTHGLSKTISLFGNNKDIIRKAYIDNPESYPDYLIENPFSYQNLTPPTKKKG